MAFSRAAASKPQARPASGAGQDDDAEAWQQMLAKERAEQAENEEPKAAGFNFSSEHRKRMEVAKARAEVEDKRWNDATAGYFKQQEEMKREKESEPQMSEEAQRRSRIQRSKEEAAKRAQASGGGGFGGFSAPSAPTAPTNAPSAGKSGFAWKKPAGSSSAAAMATHSAARSAVGVARSAAMADLPGHDECELAVSAMVSRTTQGMREGLRQLSLPDQPLKFSPGKELVLCGHDVREVVNEMIHAWMTDEKDDFFNVLLRIKGIVAKPIVTDSNEYEDIGGGSVGFEAMLSGGEPAAKPKPTAPPADDSDDEVIDVSEPAPKKSAGLNFAKMAASAVSPASATAAPGEADDEDYYGILGIAPTAPLAEVRSKFRQMVVTAHPEKGGDPEVFKRLNKAYGVLSDAEKRRQYDEHRPAGKVFVD